MARSFTPNVLVQHVFRDGEGWFRCRQCPDAFWGEANATAVVLAKAERHEHKAHGAAQGGRPQRRNVAVAAVADAAVDVSALVGVLFELARSGSLQRLGAGIARTGYLAGPYVLKVAHSGAERHNLAEWQSYQSAPAHLRKWLCPALAVAPDGAWILMRKAQMHPDWRACEQVEDALGAYVGDLHGGNIGIVDGQPVATDYADGFAGKPIDWARGRRRH